MEMRPITAGMRVVTCVVKCCQAWWVGVGGEVGEAGVVEEEEAWWGCWEGRGAAAGGGGADMVVLVVVYVPVPCVYACMYNNVCI